MLIMYPEAAGLSSDCVTAYLSLSELNVAEEHLMVTILEAAELPFRSVPRIATRVCSDSTVGAGATTVWEQWIEPHGFIPMHFHDTEEVLVFLEGEVVLKLKQRDVHVRAPASVILEANELHGLHPYGDDKVHLLGIFPTSTPKIWDAEGNPRPLPTNDTNTTHNPYELNDSED